jgi:hypothetical protein
MDVRPNGFDLAFAVHAAIWAFGVVLIDNALLDPPLRPGAAVGVPAVHRAAADQGGHRLARKPYRASVAEVLRARPAGSTTRASMEGAVLSGFRAAVEVRADQ